MTDEVARQWLAAMLGVSIQFTVLAAIAAVALLALPRLAPSIRHLVWLLVLLRLTVPVGLTSPFGALPPSLFQTQSTDAPSRNSRIGGGLAETSTVVAIPGDVTADHVQGTRWRFDDAGRPHGLARRPDVPGLGRRRARPRLHSAPAGGAATGAHARRDGAAARDRATHRCAPQGDLDIAVEEHLSDTLVVSRSPS